jgi:hypothetical protein
MRKLIFKKVRRSNHKSLTPTPSSSTTLETSNLNETNITTNRNVTEPENRVEIAKYTKLNDVCLWEVLAENDISYWIKKGSSECQCAKGPFEKSRQSFRNQIRYCSTGLFYSNKANGEKYSREWLVCSPTIGRVHCFVYKLLSKSSNQLATDGFNDWRNPVIIQKHGNCVDHRNALLTFLIRQCGLTLDSHLGREIKKE